jgi:hypothetical protein
VSATYLIPPLLQHWVDNNGNPLYNGQIATFAAGTNTPLATYKDSTGISLNTNPIILNPRGEAAVWQLPNIATKYVVSDSQGNLIATIDNVINASLITLYGGIDTGSANAFILNFTASFSAYTDGIIIVWIPANSNTTASTINVNGLGVVNIVNPDGSALFGNQIVANQPAQILFKGGVFELITPAVSLIKTATIAWAGFVTPPASTSITYRRTGNLAAITFLAQTGVSNAVTFQLSGLPALITSSVISQLVPCLGLTDNGAVVTSASVAQVNAAGTINFFKDPSLGNWTNAGNKGFNANTTVVYPL